MPLSKQTLYRLLALGLATFLAACAGGPAPQPSPSHVRKSIYYGNKGADLLNKGCYVSALNYFQEAHQRYTAADNQQGVAQSLNSIADLYYRLGDMDSALLVYDDAIAVYQDLQDNAGLIRALSNKAATLVALNRLDEAGAIMDQADALDADGSQAAIRLKNRALLQIKRKDLQTADHLLAQALASADESQAAIRSSIYFASGHTALLENRTDQAREALTSALEIDRAAAAYDLIARDLQGLGECWVREGNPTNAVTYFKRSAKIYALLKNRSKADEATVQLKQSAAQAGVDIQATLHWIKQWLEDGKSVDLCD